MLAINAVSTDLTIKTAIEKLPANAVRLMAAADVDLAGKAISVSEIDRKLAASRLSTIEKLQLKIQLNRSGLLVD